MKDIRIANKCIGKRRPVFIIAEVGINHNGNPRLAKELVRKAKECGADAVKFQTFKAESLCSQKSQYFKLFKSVQIRKDGWLEITRLARSLNIIFLSTPFDEESVDLLNNLKVPAFKVASGDLTYLPFLKYIAKKDKPVLLSTGASTILEVGEALKEIYSTGNKKVVLLHCVSNYPAKAEDVNLKVIETLERKFKVPVGLSDHTIGTTIPVAAVSLGAKVIEKHFTLNKDLAGPDHKLSLNPEEFKEMVKQIRMIESALGNGKKLPCKSEEEIKKMIRRSIVARADIPEGTIITKEMLKISRPGTGIQPKFFKRVISKTVRRNIDNDEVLNWDNIRI